MIVHMLSAGDGYTYLTRQVASADQQRSPGQALADYYTVTGNRPGRWMGRGATDLGVAGAGARGTDASSVRPWRAPGRTLRRCSPARFGLTRPTFGGWPVCNPRPHRPWLPSGRGTGDRLVRRPTHCPRTCPWRERPRPSPQAPGHPNEAIHPVAQEETQFRISRSRWLELLDQVRTEVGIVLRVPSPPTDSVLQTPLPASAEDAASLSQATAGCVRLRQSCVITSGSIASPRVGGCSKRGPSGDPASASDVQDQGRGPYPDPALGSHLLRHQGMATTTAPPAASPGLARTPRPSSSPQPDYSCATRLG
jgi:hypothetical protein